MERPFCEVVKMKPMLQWKPQHDRTIDGYRGKLQTWSRVDPSEAVCAAGSRTGKGGLLKLLGAQRILPQA